MLIGEYVYKIDAKRRLAIPSKFRGNFIAGAVIAKGLDNCLFLYSKEEWERISNKLSTLPVGQSSTRGFVRLMLSGASEVEIDALGRILIPDYLFNHAGFKKQVIIVGVFNRLEIWDSERWHSYKEEMEKQSLTVAEKLGESGVY